jgi:hypothetical protein
VELFLALRVLKISIGKFPAIAMAKKRERKAEIAAQIITQKKSAQKN